MQANESANDSGSLDLSPSKDEFSPPSTPPRGKRPRKRKRNADRSLDNKARKRKRCYSTEYHILVNNTIRDLGLDPLWAGRADLPPGQVGISRWSPEEKELLYRGLVRYGRDNLPAIAALIGSKSELEVHVYLQLLQDSKMKLHTYSDRQSLSSGADVPAAVEISEPCCAALEQMADSLAFLQQRHEEYQEKKKHPDLWKLDQKAAEWVNQRMSEGDDGLNEVRDRLPAAEVLNLDSFLDLSAKCFMNSSEPDSNFRSFVSRFEKPSMIHAAFSDVYSVVLSITKRIIQSSLFFAMSRLRATSSSSYSHSKAVKQADVLAALDVLAMKRNARAFWVELPRRCKLGIHNGTSKTGYEGAMDYDEVERILGRTPTSDADLVGESQKEDSDSDSNQASSSDAVTDSASPSALDRVESPDLIPSHGSATTSSLLSAEDFDHTSEAYLEYVDQRASRKEEFRLWEMLGKEPLSLAQRETTSRPKHPGPYRQSKDDLDDWRGWTEIRPEWEAYDPENLDHDFTENRRQMRMKSAKLARADMRKRHAGLHRNIAMSRSPEPSVAVDTHATTTSNHGSTDQGSNLEDESSLHERSSGAGKELDHSQYASMSDDRNRSPQTTTRSNSDQESTHREEILDSKLSAYGESSEAESDFDDHEARPKGTSYEHEDHAHISNKPRQTLDKEELSSVGERLSNANLSRLQHAEVGSEDDSDNRGSDEEDENEYIREYADGDSEEDGSVEL